jgi:hypothetical protein
VDSNGYSYYSASKAGGSKPSKAAKAPKAQAAPAQDKSTVDTAALEKTILEYLAANGSIDNTESFCGSQSISKEDLEPVLKSLLVDDYVCLEVIERKIIELTDEGNTYANEGSPEFQFVTKMA